MKQKVVATKAGMKKHWKKRLKKGERLRLGKNSVKGKFLVHKNHTTIYCSKKVIYRKS